MTNLSPAAQALLDAIDGIERPQWIAEAALYVVADQVVPAEPENEDLDLSDLDDNIKWGQWSQRQRTRRALLAIAAELEALDD